MTQQVSFDRVIQLLTYQERMVARHLAEVITIDASPINASQIADKAHVSKSLLNSALRLFAAAGLLETHSLGSKGTMVKALWSGLPGALRRLSA